MLCEALDVGGFNTHLRYSNPLSKSDLQRGARVGKDSEGESHCFASGTNHAANSVRLNQQNLLWSQIWIGVGLNRLRSMLSELLHLPHFRNFCKLCRFSSITFAIYFCPLEFNL